jgi:ribosomal protein S18 acetylase RimI-like enzyme
MNIIRIDETNGELVYELFDQYRVFYKQPSNLELARSFIQQRLRNNESVIFVALTSDTNKPVGFTQLYPSYSSVRAQKAWILNDLYVDRDYRKQGVGEKLIQTAMEFARQDGASFVELSTAIDNYTARGLYEKIGFAKMAPETGFITYRIGLTA